MHIDPALVRRLYAAAGGARWRLPLERFAESLAASADRVFASKAASSHEIERYLAGLHLEDLALASACMAGHEDAWEHLLREHRPALSRAADALDPSGGARELADSLFGELFDAGKRDGAPRSPRSLLRYFHGRSSLATWLRSVLAQRFVDRVRVERRERPLADDESAQALPARAQAPDPERPQRVAAMRTALESAIADLAARDRLRLACYYAQGLSLAETGRVLREHEATVSRQLARTRQFIRGEVERRLKEDGMPDAAIGECFASMAADPGPLDLRELIGPVTTEVVGAARKAESIVQRKSNSRD